MYDACDKEINYIRCLYYNKCDGVEISKFVNIDSIVKTVFLLLNTEVREAMKERCSWFCFMEE